MIITQALRIGREDMSKSQDGDFRCAQNSVRNSGLVLIKGGLK